MTVSNDSSNRNMHPTLAESPTPAQLDKAEKIIRKELKPESKSAFNRLFRNLTNFLKDVNPFYKTTPEKASDQFKTAMGMKLEYLFTHGTSQGKIEEIAKRWHIELSVHDRVEKVKKDVLGIIVGNPEPDDPLEEFCQMKIVENALQDRLVPGFNSELSLAMIKDEYTEQLDGIIKRLDASLADTTEGTIGNTVLTTQKSRLVELKSNLESLTEELENLPQAIHLSKYVAGEINDTFNSSRKIILVGSQPQRAFNLNHDQVEKPAFFPE